MNALHPSVKVGLVLLGLIVSGAVAWGAVVLWQLATDTPQAQASSGMYAFGDMVLGVAVFAMLAIVPISFALYWLRPVSRFWSVLLWGAMLWALTGIFALAAGVWANQSTSNWLFLAHARIGIMPLSTLALLTCALFAPRTRDRWLLVATAVVDGAIFAGVVMVKYVLPGVSGG